uniref:Chemokine interleukin-8-like domain-containing protein n=1 Tax=Meleagris gallopavo TaxID=9103 RepID=G1MSI9_MELGA
MKGCSASTLALGVADGKSSASPIYTISPWLCFPEPTDDIPLSCCYRYVSRPIPYNFIASVYATSSICSTPAVIVVTKKKREICADPKQFWVQALLELSRTEKLDDVVYLRHHLQSTSFHDL